MSVNDRPTYGWYVRRVPGFVVLEDGNMTGVDVGFRHYPCDPPQFLRGGHVYKLHVDFEACRCRVEEQTGVWVWSC
jgi:hypothetical protein